MRLSRCSPVKPPAPEEASWVQPSMKSSSRNTPSPVRSNFLNTWKVRGRGLEGGGEGEG